MGLIVSPFPDCVGDRKQFRESEAEPRLSRARADWSAGTFAGDESVGIPLLDAKSAGGLAEIADMRPPQAPEQKPRFAGSDAASARVVDRVVEPQFDRVAFDRVADVPASDRVIAAPGKGLRERLRRPLMLALPILLAAFGAAYYLAEEPYVSTDDAFVRAAKITVNARVAGQAIEIAVHDNQHVRQGQVLFRIDPE
ncbi:MAG TPA: biotin/lipoyl-binding protein, partial [Bradyrhizobium sp.]|nr:biotin/lipoyl-binding protein [Bradyrhizobium sp.]